MTIGQLIAAIAGALGALSVVGAFFAWIIKRVTATAYTKGEHNVEHVEMRTDIDSAHVKIRVLEDRVGDVEAEHSALMSKVDIMIDYQKTILRHVIPSNGRGGSGD